MPESKKPAGEGAKITIHHEDADTSGGHRLPSGAVSAAGDKLTIDVEKINTRSLKDQRARMVASDGCYSNPGGPSC